MRPPSAPLTVWLYRRPADRRKSYDGLSALAKQTLGEDPLSGAVFCFVVDVLQPVGEHPMSRVEELTPKLWKAHFADNPLRSDVQRDARQ